MKRGRGFVSIVVLMLIASGCVLRVSTNAHGAQLDAASAAVAVSANGRFVLFNSNATNAVSGDTNAGLDAFVRDLKTGSVTRASVGLNNAQLSDAGASDMDASGRYVVFTTRDSIDPADPINTADAYLRDLVAGTTTLVSIAPNGSPFPAAGYPTGIGATKIAGDGTSVIFTYYDAGVPPTNRLYRRDLKTGVTTQLSGPSQITTLFVSHDGTHIAYNTGCFHTGGCFPKPGVFDLNGSTYGALTVCAFSQVSDISDDGRYVLGQFLAPGPGCLTGTGAFDRSNGTLAALPISLGSSAFATSMSSDLRYIAYAAQSSTNPYQGTTQISVFDTVTATSRLISAAGDGTPGDNDSSGALMSANGKRVVFTTLATNLVSDDTNGVADVYSDPARQ